MALVEVTVVPFKNGAKNRICNRKIKSLVYDNKIIKPLI